MILLISFFLQLSCPLFLESFFYLFLLLALAEWLQDNLSLSHILGVPQYILFEILQRGLKSNVAFELTFE
jgi:hypothetical protein